MMSLGNLFDSSGSFHRVWTMQQLYRLMNRVKYILQDDIDSLVLAHLFEWWSSSTIL